MRLVTLNTWKQEGDLPRRLPVMCRQLQALQPDVVFLQEVFSPLDESWSTAAELAEALAMTVWFAPARTKKRPWRGQACMSDSGLAILSRRALRDRELLMLPTDARDGDRLVMLARADSPWGPITLANTHLTHLTDRGDLRESQLRMILGTLAASPLWVAGGDLNLTPEDAQIDALRDRYQLQPWPVNTRLSCFQGDDRAGALDYLIHGGARMRGTTGGICLHEPLDGVYASDHCGVVMDIEYQAVENNA